MSYLIFVCGILLGVCIGVIVMAIFQGATK